MSLPESGTISLDDIQKEHGGLDPISLSEYYSIDIDVPSSGVISISDFYGINTISGNLIRTTLNPDGDSSGGYDAFGCGCGISGTKYIVGAAGEGPDGAGYVFNLATGNLVRRIDGLNNGYGPGANDYGHAIATSEGYCILGAPNLDTYDPINYNTNFSAGRAEIFNVNTGAWVGSIWNQGSPAYQDYDYLGMGVAINELYAVATSKGDSALYIFDILAATVTHYIDMADMVLMAFDIAVNDTKVIVGAAGNASVDGKVKIYNLATGALDRTILDPSTNRQVGFGTGLDIGTTYCIVGAPFDDTTGTNSGRAYLINYSTGALYRTFENPNVDGTTDSDFFGYAAAMNDKYCAIAATQETSGGGTVSNSGVVYVFEISTGNLVKTIINPNTYGTGVDDKFGADICMNDTKLVISNYLDDDGSTNYGVCYVFD